MKGLFSTLLRNVCFFFLIGSLQATFGQTKMHPQGEFDKLNKSYYAGKLSGQAYFVKADSIVHLLFSEGTYFETKELVNMLSVYETIAWSSSEYQRARISYYYLFFNNARMFKKKGASMYYAEKITTAYKEYGEDHPLIEQLQKSKIYEEQRLYDKIIGLFDSEKKYLESLPGLLDKNSVDESVGLNALYVLSPVLSAFIKTNDTVSVERITLLTRQIGAAIQRKYPISRTQMLYTDLLLIGLELSVTNFERRYHDAKGILDQMEVLKITYKDQVTNFIDNNLVKLRLENYLYLKDVDSAQVYISKYETSPNFGQSQSANLAEFKAEFELLRGNYSAAYNYLAEALKHERDLQGDLMTEANDLLYAYTQFEHSSIALEKAEKVKQQRTLWLVLISAAACIIILSIYLVMVYRSRKAREQLEALNDTVNMQIVALEEEKHQAVRDEQQRLGQDLHDGLSSSIAAIRHQLEILVLDTENGILKERLITLQGQMEHAYKTARSKSHEFFSTGDKQLSQSFERQIILLAESSLPDSRYNKTIHIDDDCLLEVGADNRITLLRVVQEALTNIIKHAKARNVEILMYEEKQNLVLTINDDGVGLDKNKLKNGKPTLGLLSIRRRVQSLGGEVNIHSLTKGTEIAISIPLI